MNKIKATAVSLAFFAMVACDGESSKTVKTVKIGNQIWMAENLNRKLSGSMCFGDNSDNCKICGRLYDLETAMKACPKGWHLPNTAEWQTLLDFVGGKDIAGKKLKATSWNGTDDYGFTALPCEDGVPADDGFVFLPIGMSHWWIATEKPHEISIFTTYDNVRIEEHQYSGVLNSVRCVKD